MPSAFDINGVEEALLSFTEIARQAPRKVARKALLKASTPLLNAARDNLQSATKKRTGNLLASMATGKGRVIRNTRKNSIGQPYVVVGPAWPLGAHGHLIEYGHRVVIGKRHGRASNADAVAQAALGGEDYQALAADPAFSDSTPVGGFVPARPFLRPAIDSTRKQVEGAIYREMLKHFEKEAAKHVRGSTAAASSAI